MPQFLDGEQNLAGLSVPGAYGDIILPTPFIVGTPTNIEALIGVGSWGPVNALIPASTPANAALSIGVPKIRKYDIASHIAAATQIGGSIGFLCVRVTDDTDVAASGALNPVASVAANGSIVFTSNPANGSTLTLNGSSIEFVSSGATGNEVVIGVDLASTLTVLQSFLAGSSDTQIQKFQSTVDGSTLHLTAAAAGTSGNALTIATTVTGATPSGATLSGGAAASQGLTVTGKYSGSLGNGIRVSIENGTKAGSYMGIVSFPGMPPEQFNNIEGSGNAFWQNLAAAINNGNAFHGPSRYVVASAGTSTAAPTVATPVTLSGGTDGDAGVTDSTLMGQDVLPRKGMYALRSAPVDCFTLIDHSTKADWAAIASFGIAEGFFPVQAEPSGGAYADAISDRGDAGIDTPWFKLITGDWPTFYDSYNGVSRLINPSAIALGRYGNLSPQESALNKPLQGVSATETSTLGQTYSDTDLSLINEGGIDTILPATQSPGGNYFSFATGRNCSSNTAARGDEYTRLTNFLMKSAQSKAAGSFVGRLQSIQPNDQTRSDAKALFDGFSAQLADPQSGTGINGQGMIDAWAVKCDLSINPPDLQAKGYLFLYWQVRYLNVVRYFVVKFQGGGNVSVSVQSTAPTPQQFQQAA